MCAILAAFAIRTEASQIMWAKLVFLVMFQSAVGPEWAEPAVVVGTRRAFGLGVDVQVEAVITVRACEGAGVI